MNKPFTLKSSIQSLSRSARGYLIALIGITIWSATAVFIRYLTENAGVPALVLAFWRDVFACLTMLAALWVIRRSLLKVDQKLIPFFIGYGFLLSLFNSLWTISVALNGAAVSTVLAYSSAAFTAVIAWRLWGESLNTAKILAILFSLAGCALVAGAFDLQAWQSNTLGVITGLLSGLGFTGYSLMGKEAARRKINSWTALTYTFGIAALFLLAYNFLLANHLEANLASNIILPHLNGIDWGILVVLAMGPTIGGYGLYTLSMNYLPASVVNLIATLEPSITAVQSYLLLGERFSIAQIVGSLLVIAGVVLLRVLENRSRSK